MTAGSGNYTISWKPNFRFPGQYEDSDMGTAANSRPLFVQNHYREYMPRFGRYNRVDPIYFNGTLRLIFMNKNHKINFIIYEKTKRYDSRFYDVQLPNWLKSDVYYYSYNNPIFFYDSSGYGPTGQIIGGIIGGGIGLYGGITLGGLGGAAFGGGGGAVSCSVVAPGVGTVACGVGGGAVGGAIGAAVGGVAGAIGGGYLGYEIGDDLEDLAIKCAALCAHHCDNNEFIKCFMACLAAGGPPAH